uniref:7-dehydrocholesterol reductase n=2 Tax=Timema TaxID=61471 RepID=A0A7R9FNJ2_9NEOP|nr:unnamed protein product [Timema tahoe]
MRGCIYRLGHSSIRRLHLTRAHPTDTLLAAGNFCTPRDMQLVVHVCTYNCVLQALIVTMAGGWYAVLRYHVTPPLFLVFFPGVVNFMALWGQGERDVTWGLAASKALGNSFSWAAVGVLVLWATVWLHVPARATLGPPTKFGYRPPYKDNGVLYYWVSLTAYFVLEALFPGLSTALFLNMPELLGSLNVSALLLCGLLFVKGRYLPDHPQDKQPPRPVLYEFFTGLELHPRLLGMDVKQLTNCRVGLMAWQLLIIAFYIAGVERHGFNIAALVNLLLQSMYLAKFFWWEYGYFNTLDIILDRAGYYICWGCLVWVPCLYTFSSYYLVAHPPQISNLAAVGAALLGVATTLLNYRVDYEKQVFRSAPDGKCVLWGKPARYIVANLVTSPGKSRKLLVSGFWGVARHLNYTFELVATLAWCLPGWGLGLWPFLYFYFLVALLVHRTFRDEEKCSAQYGDSWELYCKEVPYRLVPYVF